MTRGEPFCFSFYDVEVYLRRCPFREASPYANNPRRECKCEKKMKIQCPILLSSSDIPTTVNIRGSGSTKL